MSSSCRRRAIISLYLLVLFFWEVSFAFCASSATRARITTTVINRNGNSNSMSSSSSLTNHNKRRKTTASSSSASYAIPSSDDDDEIGPSDADAQQGGAGNDPVVEAGRLEELKQREAELSAMLASVRREKLSALRSRPLTIGVVGFGRFGQFIARTFAKYGRVVVTSRSDYTEIARGMGVKYIPLDRTDDFLAENLDVIVFAVSILSFQSTVRAFLPHLKKYLDNRRFASAGSGGNGASSQPGPLVVDVLSVKEHARAVLLELLPPECDILCTHPMFGPDSGKGGWHNLNFVYEKTRIDRVVLDPRARGLKYQESFIDESGTVHSVHEDSEAHVEGVDRIERFLSIWEEEGCRMVPMSCRDHDAYAANSQFITHLVGRVLGVQGLSQTPIDTSGFQSVLKLVDSTTADSFDLFYGLYKYNQNSEDTIKQLQSAMDDVVVKLAAKEQEEQKKIAESETRRKEAS